MALLWRYYGVTVTLLWRYYGVTVTLDVRYVLGQIVKRTILPQPLLPSFSQICCSAAYVSYSLSMGTIYVISPFTPGDRLGKFGALVYFRQWFQIIY